MIHKKSRYHELCSQSNLSVNTIVALILSDKPFFDAEVDIFYAVEYDWSRHVPVDAFIIEIAVYMHK